MIMRLFVANTSKQNFIFNYKVFGDPINKHVNIEAGKQAQLPIDFQPEDISYIISQYEVYGFISADKVKSTKEFVGLCYSIDKPININLIELAFTHNDQYLEELGKKIRIEAAVAMNNQLEESALGKTGDFKTSVVEDKQIGIDKPTLAEGVIVSKKAKK